MSLGLNQIGASVRGLAFAMAQRGRVDGDQVLAVAATDQVRAGLLRTVQPKADARATDQQIRDQVLAERGLDRASLMRLTPQARIAAETSITAETVVLARQAQVRATGAFVDLRV